MRSNIDPCLHVALSELVSVDHIFFIKRNAYHKLWPEVHWVVLVQAVNHGFVNVQDEKLFLSSVLGRRHEHGRFLDVCILKGCQLRDHFQGAKGLDEVLLVDLTGIVLDLLVPILLLGTQERLTQRREALVDRWRSLFRLLLPGMALSRGRLVRGQ